MTGDRNRLGDAVALLMDAATLLNNQGEVAKRIDAFLSTIHPAECVELPDETPHADKCIAALWDVLQAERGSRAFEAALARSRKLYDEYRSRPQIGSTK